MADDDGLLLAHHISMTPQTHVAPPAFAGLDLLSSAVVLVDAKLQIRYVNPAAENLFAVSQRLLNGHPLRQLVGEPTLAGHEPRVLERDARVRTDRLERGALARRDLAFPLHREHADGLAARYQRSRERSARPSIVTGIFDEDRFTRLEHARGKRALGDPVTAGDFVYSFQRLVDPATAADYAPIADFIVGAEQIRKGEEKDFNKLGVVAVDDKTLKITLTKPTPFFPSVLRHSSFLPVRKADVEKFGQDFTKPGNLIGNGAFTLQEWVPQSQITMVKNPNFHDAANVKLDKLVYYPTTTREQFHHMGRVTDNLSSGKVFADLGLPPMNPAEDRAMVCGSLAFNIDVKAILEGFGLREGANSEPQEFVVEKAFVGDGI